MRRQFWDHKDSIVWIETDLDCHRRAVFFIYPTHQGERKVCPLVKFNAAMIIRLKQRKFAVFVERTAFEFEPWGIDMCADHMKAFLQAILTNHHQRNCAIAINLIQLRTRHEPSRRCQRGETILLGKGYSLGHEAQLGARLGNKILIVFGKGKHFGALVCGYSHPARSAV